jgi:hypothetical protein
MPAFVQSAGGAPRPTCPQIASAGHVPARAATLAVSSCGRSSAVAALAAGPTVAPVGAPQNGGA